MAVISQEIDRLPLFKGDAWRAESGYSHGRHDTAGDVIRFERDELENDFGLPESLIRELDQYHASDLTWVTRKRKHCLVYLSEGEGDECVGKSYMGENPRIVVDTGEEGLLLLHGEAIPIVKVANVTKLIDTTTYPLVLSQTEYEEEWKPQGWKVIFIGPTSTWRQDWGSWEAIRDIVQNCLDETEAYQFGYDAEGLWISDQGNGVAVADFLLGPPKLKPDWARGKFGEGMKIAALAMVRDGYAVRIETVSREIFIVFIEQEVNGHVQSLAALWRPNGATTGTKFHFKNYHHTAYPERFAVNLPSEAILFMAPSLTTKPRQRFNQLIDPLVSPEGRIGDPSEPPRSKIYARDIYMTDINSPFSYNLWSFDLAPDRFAPRDETSMWRDVGRLWACVTKPILLEHFLRMVASPALEDSVETHNVQLDDFLGLDPLSDRRYMEIMEEHKESWGEAWRKVFGDNATLTTDRRWDSMVKHLGYTPIEVGWGVKDGLMRVIKTDLKLINESQERLREVEVIPDENLTLRQKASLDLAREIANDITRRKLGGVHAAIIPPASDRVRTAGMYGRSTREIFISADQLESGRSTVDTTIHEIAHHTSGAEDGQEAHNAELSRVAGKVVGRVAEKVYDQAIAAPAFTWY